MATLESRLTYIADHSDEAVALALHDTAMFILTLIRLYVPVRTGWLRDSYKKESLGLMKILIGTMVNYSVFVEFGTSRQAAKPHLTPAFWQSQNYFFEQLKKRHLDLG